MSRRKDTMDRTTHQEVRVTRHRRYPRWGRLAKIKDFRKVNAKSWCHACLREDLRGAKWAIHPEDLYYEKGGKNA